MERLKAKQDGQGRLPGEGATREDSSHGDVGCTAKGKTHMVTTWSLPSRPTFITSASAEDNLGEKSQTRVPGAAADAWPGGGKGSSF